MKFSTARSERITAIVSTLVAVAILAGGVTAYQSHSQPVEDIVQLESDLRFQLEVAFGHDPNQRIERLARLEQVSQAWQNSPREPADRDMLASWLLEATIRSMPGSIEPLPNLPDFGQRRKPEKGPDPAVRLTAPEPTANEVVNEIELEDQVVMAVESDRAPVTSEPGEPLATPAASVAHVASTPSTEVGPSISLAENHRQLKQPLVETVRPLQPTVLEPQVAEPVRVNLTELAARITGYHNGLNEVETALRRLAPDDFQALTVQIQQLDEMTRDYQFVDLYYRALTEQEQRTITAPRSLTPTLREVEQRLDRSQTTASGDFLEEFDSSNQEQLAMLRRRLSEVASRIDR